MKGEKQSEENHLKPANGPAKGRTRRKTKALLVVVVPFWPNYITKKKMVVAVMCVRGGLRVSITGPLKSPYMSGRTDGPVIARSRNYHPTGLLYPTQTSGLSDTPQNQSICEANMGRPGHVHHVGSNMPDPSQITPNHLT